ncbi:hypothetical protein PL11201_70014 [Planktothrix sp. PCC 11201]|uniref:hypothetical protein n=1 Tax=Planktothrix sp. PCC 11201 TaxID=1729650 RepID=UPI0009225A54|nr:hypothetical protein [Planktothrix sp. PCC 11201]SKB15167.1 hypothetical protein PL11201_70014 [Planktothrix sp. PCC 11201]
MIISDLNYLEVVSEATTVFGGCDEPPEPNYNWSEEDLVSITFETINSFTLNITAPGVPDGNYASAGAKAVADSGTGSGLNSFVKADTLAVTTYGLGGFAGSTSVAAING